MLYDITPPITPALPVWPGDNAATREVLMHMDKGDTVTLSTLRATVHLGAHADAPNHYAKDGRDIAAQPLERYIGPCQVVRISIARGERIGARHLPKGVDISEKRVLFATNTYDHAQGFTTDFAALEPALIDMLGARDVATIGIDTPSVDLFDSKDLPAHAAMHRNDIAILEGLILRDVPPGRYELIAPPLALVGFDASPVRAVLRTID
ncbi:MAG: kynurenine formamidase [Phycisphaerales bacterium]|nr:MAG: kynurenine formamidase [Phycisphaerales bacterium]